MNSDLQLQVQAYLDNELTPGDARRIAGLLTSDPEARDLYNELKGTKSAVRQNEPVLRLPESRDFFWSKIQREINKIEQVPARPAPGVWWTRLVAPLAGAVALFAVLLSISGSRPTEGPVTLSKKPVESAKAGPYHEGQVVAPDMSAITFRSEAPDSNERGATVVWISSNLRESAPAASWLEWLE